MTRSHTLKILGSLRGVGACPLRKFSFSALSPPTVPPEIISSPPPFDEIIGNPPHVLRVTFLSSIENISWYKDGVIIPEAEIFLNDTYGETQLKFSSITREDSGVYRVVVESNQEALPEERRAVETSFEVKVVGTLSC